MKKAETISKIDRGFDRVAWFYDKLAKGVYGSSIRDAQIRFLDHIPQDSRVLLIGGGTGWILDHFPDRNLYIHYVEASPLMLEKAKKRKIYAKSNKVFFELGTEQSVIDQPPYDVVFTAFFLDLFEKNRFAKVFSLLDQILKNNGTWLWTDFVVPKEDSFNRLLLSVMYWFFRITCGIEARNLPPTDPFFKSFGYRQIDEAYFFKNFICTKVFLKKSN